MSRRGSPWFAFAASFAVYAIPVVSAHWADLLGVALVREMASDRQVAWKASSLAAAVTLQLLLFLLAWGLSKLGRGIAIAGVIAACLLSTFAVPGLYLAVIPARFLIQPDDTPDVSNWPVACEIRGYMLDPVRGGVSRGLDKRGEAWIRGDDGSRYAILRASDCAVEPASIPQTPIAAGLHQALPDGSVVYTVLERGASAYQYWLLRRGAARGELLGPGPEIPLVSEDGAWVARIARDTERRASVEISPIGGGKPILFTDGLLQQASLALVELDMARREIVINRDLSTFARLRLDGSVVWGPIRPEGVSPQMDTFRYPANGSWLAWDAYVERRAYRISWMVAGTAGAHDVPLGSGITSAAMDPKGRYAAVSTTTSLNIGNARDRVRVMRASGGAAVFRRWLPRYTRTQVAFLGDDYFAYSEVDGGKGVTRVLRIPE